MHYTLLVLLSTLSLAACSSTKPDPQADDLAILFIGNSLTYTNDLPGILSALLSETGTGDVVVESIAGPNFGLQDHWANQDTRSRIIAVPWDYVILQQGPSATEGRPSLIDYSKRFAPLIKSVGATPALYMVWPSEVRIGDFRGVRESYRAAADSVDGLFFPSGAAWQEYWSVAPEVELYGPDRFHPTPEASYLSAVVMWEQISGGSADDLDLKAGTEYGSVTIPFGIGRNLHDAAHSANQKYARSITR
ncbi:MAG: SGNH/GDSL hydrolase family protein [Rhodothermales bacterium]|nr:SGNH/GDSL hydrolase family protein [Rhodothermales bacterium]